MSVDTSQIAVQLYGVSTFQPLLVLARAEQESQLAAHEKIIDELTGLGDPVSVEEREIAEIAAANCREVLFDIGLALDRLVDGTFGSCVICARPIHPERLEAVPFARLCVECHERPISMVA